MNLKAVSDLDIQRSSENTCSAISQTISFVIDKMAKDMPGTYKKYVIQRIINPGVYLMSKNHNCVVYKREMQQFNFLLAKNVEKVINTEKISIGKIIAVKDEAGFHRGLVNDIFNRNNRITYLILLIDHGNMIETNEKKLFWIRNKELLNKKASAVKVSIRGIKPVALDLKCDKYFMDGLFQKRVQNNWSACAFKYVQELFKKNPCVFVKPLQTSNSNISGEIYFIQESEKAPVSLGQKLCDEGFAIFSEINSRIYIAANLQGGSNLDIEEKIPYDALPKNIQDKEILKSVRQINDYRVGSSSTTSTELTNPNFDPIPEHSKTCIDSEEQNLLSMKNISDSKKSSFSNSSVLISSTHSSSLKLKENLNSSHSSCDSLKKHIFPNSEETSSSIDLETSKVRIFRVMKRSLELYEKEKKRIERVLT